MDSPDIDIGSGSLVVLIPGIPGRWEWIRPAIDALAARHRVLSFSLAPPAAPKPSFERWTATIDALIDRTGATTAAIVGVSFGGLVAIHYAASRPSRTRALVVVSAPSPGWRPDPRTARYMRYPRIALPLLAARSVVRLAPEVLAARRSWRARARLAAAYGWRALRAPADARAIVSCVEAWRPDDLVAACRRVTAPTTLITGEQELDRVVPVAASLEIATLIPHARHVPLRGAGHIGFVTMPDEFARLVDAALEDPPTTRAR
jgi:pimeloyl-ACP methyl ester carboxylesterase